MQNKLAFILFLLQKKLILFFAVFTFFAGGNEALTVTDYDGNVYRTVTIGTQIWLLENLKVTHYRNGDPITEVRDSINWVSLINGAWCHYNNDPMNGAVYGNLYNWYAIEDSRGLAPAGWHVPSDEEWKTLEIYLGMSEIEANMTDWRGTDQGAQLKETGTIHWQWPTGNEATNSTGFTALPGGWRIYFLYTGSFYNINTTGEWWSSTEKDASGAWLRNLCVYHADIYRISFGKTHGCSVRCISDSPVGIKNGVLFCIMFFIVSYFFLVSHFPRKT
ncbi:MAG: hypothetical protein A2161_08175 [Candidatus Schekmanbacteria bacterium RBG_13_48_7]|uniref:Fibrobacter succinogenes major paralogous domain-containing protein n=1 Tax=Candidatus Schekmanbacteria bacterium RBG_13_48_7 TaxID=1817878 RepID=A0A1F7RJE6_9BACT|nr:MAG: hypothetical protein A2161_08175 [Candidatus Schekmanbacteria bacterium RBG_13_48_7]